MKKQLMTTEEEVNVWKGDPIFRDIAIATGILYQQVYDAINVLAKDERPRGGKKPSGARTGISTKTLGKYLKRHGFEWTATMGIGTGCKVHLKADELPTGVLVTRVTKHYALVDGVLHDLSDCSRDGTRCVYGYWQRVAS